MRCKHVACEASYKSISFLDHAIAFRPLPIASAITLRNIFKSPRKIFADATMMRIYGTRLPICEKNVGQALYAFNSLQSKFMPDALKPPPSALAGFLKKGKVFSKEARIES